MVGIWLPCIAPVNGGVAIAARGLPREPSLGCPGCLRPTLRCILILLSRHGPVADAEDMTDSQVEQLARLLRQRNVVDADIGALLNRPMTAGHAGEWIAARIFDIELESNAAFKALDGRFRSGPNAGRTVNVKWYLKRESLLDLTESPELDYYLVLAGPKVTSGDDRTLRPWRISSVYLFDAHRLLAEQRARGGTTGTAASVREGHWQAAEIYPRSDGPLILADEQRAMLALFAG